MGVPEERNGGLYEPTISVHALAGSEVPAERGGRTGNELSVDEYRAPISEWR